MKDPKTFAGPHIEAADVAFDIGFASGCSARLVRRTDNHRIDGDNPSGMESNLSGKRIDLLIVLEFQINRAVFAKAAHRGTGLRIQRDEPITWCDIQNPLFAAV